MKIVKVARHCCIRVMKEALPLMARGHEVHVIANKLPMFGERASTMTLFHNIEQLQESIKLHFDADVFHCHNEPSWFVTVVKQLTNIPVILDVHDSLLIRVKPEDESQVRISVDERNNFKLADGLVFVSNPQSEICRDEFNLKQPSIVLPSYVPKSLYRCDTWKWLGGVVYEGRIDLPDEIGTEELAFFKYCEYTELAKKFHDAGIVFNLYTPGKGEKIVNTYKNTAVWRGSYPYNKLIRVIGRHDWGLVGNIHENEAWKNALPNKLFEYIAAGVPIVAINALESKKFIEKYGIGIGVDSVDELCARWDEKEKIRTRLLKTQYDWCMDNYIHELEDLYDKVIC